MAGESAESLFRRGMISPKQAGKLSALKGTKLNPSFGSGEEPFHNKAGKRDQGAGRERGIPEMGSRHINNSRTQREGSAIASKVSKGGRVNAGGQPGVDAINQRQRPAFPSGAKVKRRAFVAPAKRSAAVQPSGPLYGGGNGRP